MRHDGAMPRTDRASRVIAAPPDHVYAALVDAYRGHVRWEPWPEMEARTATLLPGLMLARVDGKSPVEYITRDAQKEHVRAFSRRFLLDRCESLRQLSEAWRASLR